MNTDNNTDRSSAAGAPFATAVQYSLFNGTPTGFVTGVLLNNNLGLRIL
jgi:hypothetical protein